MSWTKSNISRVRAIVVQMLLVQAHDLGRDHEHCTAIMRKLDDVDSDMRVDDTRFIKINKLADKIISHALTNDNNTDLIKIRRNELNSKSVPDVRVLVQKNMLSIQ